MDERKNSHLPEEENWLDEILGEADEISPIGPDEAAISGAGLTRPEDAELEKIIQETLAEAEEAAPTQAQPASDDPGATRKFTPPEVPGTDGVTEEQAPVKKSKGRKGRPKMKKGYGLLGIPHIIATGVWLAIIVAIGVSLGRMLWVCASDVLAFGKPNREVTIVIAEDDSIEVIAEKLGNAGLVRYPDLFKLFATVTKKYEKIDPGEYKLNAIYDYSAMINAMREKAPARTTVEIMFTEGQTCAQIFKKLEEEGVCTVKELEEYAASGTLKEYWFLQDVPRGDKYCLEGYLFPDTYKFYTQDSPKRVLEKFLDGFNARFTDIMHERLEDIQERFAKSLEKRGFSQDYIDSHKITIREVVIIASYIQKETPSYDTVSYNISSVIYNRLSNPGNYPFLQLDATVRYALGNPNRDLTSADLQVDNPFNTYVYMGLTPGPIANPGQNCLNAALAPMDTNYYYFASDKADEYHFFSSYNAFVNFLNSL